MHRSVHVYIHFVLSSVVSNYIINSRFPKHDFTSLYLKLLILAESVVRSGCSLLRLSQLCVDGSLRRQLGLGSGTSTLGPRPSDGGLGFRVSERSGESFFSEGLLGFVVGFFLGLGFWVARL